MSAKRKTAAAKTSRTKKYAAFISFASPDRDLARILHHFLKKYLKVDSFFAEANLPREDDDWVEGIRGAVMDSWCFVPILTRSSLSRPWVLYESGMAHMCELPFCCVRTADACHDAIRRLPGKNRFVYDLFSEEGLIDFFMKVYEITTTKAEAARMEVFIRESLGKSTTTRNIIHRAKLRSVFIAGSLPQPSADFPGAQIKAAPALHRHEVIDHVTKELTFKLLEHGFTVSTCPDVSAVGLSVIEGICEWTREHGVDWRDVFRVGGRYDPLSSLDRVPQENITLVEMLKQASVETRRDYLRDQEWLLIIGGKDRTRLEWEAATGLPDLKVCALPIFGGVAAEAWAVQENRDRCPIAPTDLLWGRNSAGKLVEFMRRN